MCIGIIFDNYFYVGGLTLHGPRLELNLEPAEHSARHALLHMASEWSSHRTTRAELTPYLIWIKFCTVVDVPDVITYANFGDDGLRGLCVAGGQILPFP